MQCSVRGPGMLTELRKLIGAGIIRPIDYHFAALVGEKASGDRDLVTLTACLVSWRSGNGDVCVPLKRYAGQPLFIPERPDLQPSLADIPVLTAPPLDVWRRALLDCDWVGQGDDYRPLIIEHDCLYLARYRAFEQSIAEHLLTLARSTPEVDEQLLRAGLSRLFGPAPHSSSKIDWQRLAAAMAVIGTFTVISGGPGSGKTATVAALLTLLYEQAPNQFVALVAPTGKAATRLSESLRMRIADLSHDAVWLDKLVPEAQTIHRLLGASGDGRYRYHRHNPLHLDAVIVDEASMVDLTLMARLIDAMPQDCRLILLGDRHQLSSVEAGSVLADIYGDSDASRLPPQLLAQLLRVHAVSEGAINAAVDAAPLAGCIIELKHSYRFADDSGIARLADTINDPTTPPTSAHLRTLFRQSADLHWINVSTDSLPEQALRWALDRYQSCLESDTVEQALGRFSDVQVLCATRNGPFGVNAFNLLVEARLGDAGLMGPDKLHGQPVLITRNDYEVGLFNGDTGLLWYQDGSILAHFPQTAGATRALVIAQLPAWQPAWAITVHKSQGSEFGEVLMVLPDQPQPLVSRELIYTGVTRAARSLTIASSETVLVKACATQRERASGLRFRLAHPPAIPV